jgi:oxidase EvaA
MMTTDAGSIRNWVAQTNDESVLKVEEIGFQDCRNWHYDNGILRHETGKFFSFVGFQCSKNDVPAQDENFAMIDQPEVGWLGFVVRNRPDGIEWLLQAKTEPGNISATQIAPSIQATRSNYQRAHGGRATAFLGVFQNGQTFLSDGPHSEQGMRFMWKFNRNSVLALPDTEQLDLDGLDNWSWCPSGALRALLSDDYMINTDARSVIATAPWSILSPQSPLFTAPSLALSYFEKGGVRSLGLLVRRLEIGTSPRWTPVALGALDGWDLTDDALCDHRGHKVVGCYEVSVKGREVDNWCQPFLMHDGEPDHVLFMRITPAGAEVFVRIYSEVSFGGRKEYGPSLHSLHKTPDALGRWDTASSSRELLSLRQSDEGGRFMTAAARYRIVLVNGTEPRRQYPFGSWINLSVLEKLVSRPGCTTNELRTLVSMVLSTAFDDACLEL